MKNKKGFSLIEVLLVMGIIAVVTAIGFSVINTGMKKAYNQYWYTGYSTINDITYDGWKSGKIRPDSENLYCDYVDYIESFLPNFTVSGACNDNDIIITAQNGIKYEIKRTSDSYYIIDMTVPKAEDDSLTKTRLIFNYDNDNYHAATVRVYPANYGDTGFLNLYNRPDLLPFYIIGDDAGSFYSFKQAYCKKYGSYIAEFTIDANIDCTGITKDPNLKGKLMHISPRKAY